MLIETTDKHIGTADQRGLLHSWASTNSGALAQRALPGTSIARNSDFAEQMLQPSSLIQRVEWVQDPLENQRGLGINYYPQFAFPPF